jgi:hypothetical protein
VQLYHYFVSQSSEFCRHNPLCCFSTSVNCCLFRYWLGLETFGYTLVLSRRLRTADKMWFSSLGVGWEAGNCFESFPLVNFSLAHRITAIANFIQQWVISFAVLEWGDESIVNRTRITQSVYWLATGWTTGVRFPAGTDISLRIRPHLLWGPLSLLPDWYRG